MKHALDNALTLAETLTCIDDDAMADFMYTNMRQSFVAALDTARALQSSEPQQAIEWVLAHLPEDVNIGIRVVINPIDLDPRLGNFATAQERARWIRETQRERLQAAAGELRTANDRAMVGAVSRKDILEWLKGIDNTKSNRTNRITRSKVLVEISPGMYTAASFDLFKATEKPSQQRKPKETVDTEDDPFEVK